MPQQATDDKITIKEICYGSAFAAGALLMIGAVIYTTAYSWNLALNGQKSPARVVENAIDYAAPSYPNQQWHAVGNKYSVLVLGDNSVHTLTLRGALAKYKLGDEVEIIYVRGWQDVVVSGLNNDVFAIMDRYFGCGAYLFCLLLGIAFSWVAYMGLNAPIRRLCIRCGGRKGR